MKGDTVPDTDHVTRHCRPKQIDDNGEIQGSAFMLRDVETGLSVDWLEKLRCSNREDEIAEIRNIYYSRFNRIGAGDKIAVLNVGRVRNHVRVGTPDGRILEVIHTPEIDDDEEDPHSEIINMRPEPMRIAELIRETILETYSARRQ